MILTLNRTNLYKIAIIYFLQLTGYKKKAANWLLFLYYILELAIYIYFSIPNNSTSNIRLENGLISPLSSEP